MRRVFLLTGVLAAFAACGAADPTVERARREGLRRDWKMAVGSLDGPEGRAAQLVNARFGRYLIRDAGVYAIHVLPVTRADDTRDIPGKNVVLLGTPANNPRLAAYVRADEIPAGGYCVKAFERDGRKIVAIAGDAPETVLYGAVDFVEDGLPALATDIGNGITITSYAFDGRPWERCYESRRAPRTAVRSVFTWGHVISDYRGYFRNLARLKINEAVIWNDFEPLNAAEIVACAHSWGVKVVWGFAWGWTTGQCGSSRLDDAALGKLGDTIVADWRTTWGRLPGDGIYFQSFTERRETSVGGISVAEAAVRLVNATAARLWAERPDLRIVFGLHATSVKDRLDVIAKTDPRMEIYWEDFGGVPFDAREMYQNSEEEQAAFLTRVLSDTRRVGLVYKCQLFQDWTNFYHQQGPYLLGEAGEDVMAHDMAVTACPWRGYMPIWLEKGPYAHKVTRRLQADARRPALCLAGNFNGPVNFATALAAELFWSADEPYETILRRVLRREDVTR